MHIDAPKIFEYKLKVQHKIIKINCIKKKGGYFSKWRFCRKPFFYRLLIHVIFVLRLQHLPLFIHYKHNAEIKKLII